MILILFTLLLTCTLMAHQSTLSSAGNEIIWNNSEIPLTIFPKNSDMSSAAAMNIITDSINQWNSSSSIRLYPHNSSNNQIKFLSDFRYGSAVVGVTELTYNTKGLIQKASIYLNDNYYFHSKPGFYSNGEIYLGDVITHEMGHLLGLSHSEVLNSTMFYSAYSGQSSLAADDRSGVRGKYDSIYGTISGTVKGGNSIGVMGTHVQVISRNTGSAIGAISNENGHFKISGLDLNDTYYIYTSPLKNSASLPGYFPNIQDEFCPGTYVGSFFSPCGDEGNGKPIGITLTEENTSIDVGTITINCSLRSDLTYNNQKISPNFSPILIFDFASENRFEKSFVGWFRNSSSFNWSNDDRFKLDLSGMKEEEESHEKYLRVGLTSYPFGNQIEYQMTIFRDGVEINSSLRSLSYSADTGTYDTDFYALIPLSSIPSENIFEVRIRSRRLAYSTETFPTYKIFSNNELMPYLLNSSLYELTTSGLRPLLDTKAILSDNEMCLDAPFTHTVTKTTFANNSSDEEEGQAVAATGCGTLGPPSNRPGSSLPIMMLGFFLVFITPNVRKKFLY